MSKARKQARKGAAASKKHLPQVDFDLWSTHFRYYHIVLKTVSKIIIYNKRGPCPFWGGSPCFLSFQVLFLPYLLLPWFATAA